MTVHKCMWTPWCDEYAMGITQHSTLGSIAVCENHGLIVDFDPENPNADLLPDPAEGWFDERSNMVTLCEHLAENGYSASDIAHAVEKPWNYVDEYKLAVFEQDQP